jgi:hypothetical protein
MLADHNSARPPCSLGEKTPCSTCWQTSRRHEALRLSNMAVYPKQATLPINISSSRKLSDPPSTLFPEVSRLPRRVALPNSFFAAYFLLAALPPFVVFHVLDYCCLTPLQFLLRGLPTTVSNTQTCLLLCCTTKELRLQRFLSTTLAVSNSSSNSLHDTDLQLL